MSTAAVVYDSALLSTLAAAPEGMGGKAEGLRFLDQCGLKIPSTLVLVNPGGAGIEAVVDEVAAYFDGKNIAVRSSALDEDGDSASYAGQFETCLNVQGRDAIAEAVEACLASAQSRRVAQYREHLDGTGHGAMALVLQEMVDAECAGVIFTADPINNRWDHNVVNVVEGLGDALVSGHVPGQEFLLARNGGIISHKGDSNMLIDSVQLRELCRGARLAEKKACKPLDLEWAMDRAGTIYWLQARPITTLDSVHLNELDTPLDYDEPVFTRGNVGEMMPGPVTPLTDSTFVRAIDVGLQEYARYMGVLDRIDTVNRKYIYTYYNHLFFNLTRMYDMCRLVYQIDKANLEYSLMGKVLDTPPVEQVGSFPRRFLRFMKYIMYTTRGAAKLGELQKLIDGYSLNPDQNMHTLYDQLTKAVNDLDYAYSCHYYTSAQSGALAVILLKIFSGGKVIPHAHDFEKLAALLVDIDNIDGANLVHQLDELVAAILDDDEASSVFSKRQSNEAVSWLKEHGGAPGKLFREFLDVNGHRCIREAEFREIPWGSDPRGLVEIIGVRVRTGRTARPRKGGGSGFRANKKSVFAGVSLTQRFFLRLFLPGVRSAVARRENTKSLCIKLQDMMRKAYRVLAQKMVDENLLNDTDQIFFLRHEEIGALLSERSESFSTMAGKRRELFPVLNSLQFHDHYFDYPFPVEDGKLDVEFHDGITGLPVSRGVVTGKARIVDSLDDAGDLEPGEIMISSYTDIGWTPYFGIIGGLVTEIGSSLSHGAVVAREYGIPAVLSVKQAKQLIRTGDVIRLDGGKGTVEILENV